MDEYSEDDELFEVTNKSEISFKQMLDRTDLSDITLSCGKRNFHVHRMLLAACSPYFRCLFRKRPTKQLNIVLENVAVDDLKRVLYYMYHGSIMLVDKHIQGFCELLEMFMMTLPNNVLVSSSESESEPQPNDACDFVDSVRDILNNIHKGKLAQQSSSVLALIAMEADKLFSVIKMMLHLLLQIKQTTKHALLFPLVKHLCLNNGNKGLRNDTVFFREQLRIDTLQLLLNLCNVDVQTKHKAFNSSENAKNNSLDEQVNCLESIRYHCATLRIQRLKHFVSHLFFANIVTLGDLHDIKKTHPSLVADLIAKPHPDGGKCCDIDLSSAVKKLMQKKWYQSLQPIEDKMFWTRIDGIKQSAATLLFAKNERVKMETKRQRRSARRNLEKLTNPEKFAKKEAKRLAKKAKRKLKRAEKANNLDDNCLNGMKNE